MTTDAFHAPPYFVYGIASGFVGVFVTFYLMRDVLVPNCTTPSFRKRVARLKTRKDKNFFYITLPSMIHSLAHSCFHPRLISFGASPQHFADRVAFFDDTWPAFFQGVFVGYLAADFCLLGPVDLGPAYIVHHLSAMAIWSWSTCLGAMQWYASFLQFAEFSTIFLNLRQWVLTAGYPSDSPLAMGISLLFFTSFFVVRVIPLPVLVIQWVTFDFQKLLEEKGKVLAVASSVTLTIHLLLQSFWFFLMVNKILRIVLSGSKKKK